MDEDLDMLEAEDDAPEDKIEMIEKKAAQDDERK